MGASRELRDKGISHGPCYDRILLLKVVDQMKVVVDFVRP